MFPTFTGTSRRPRNVNLSGQRTTNPWGTSSWSPSASGASKTVAQAQAEREKRQRERDELNAAKRLQRVWRRHREIQSFKHICREDFDALYSQPNTSCHSTRIANALPLLVVLFDPARTEDQQRLDLFIGNLTILGSNSSNFDVVTPESWDRLARLLVEALERYVHARCYEYWSHIIYHLLIHPLFNSRSAISSQEILGILIDLVRRRPTSILPISSRYYQLLSRYFEQSSHVGVPAKLQEILTDAVTVPLVSNSRQGQYIYYSQPSEVQIIIGTEGGQRGVRFDFHSLYIFHKVHS